LALEEAGVFRAAGVSAGALYRALVYNALRRRVAEEVEEAAAAAAAAARLEQQHQHQQHETPARPRHVRPAPSWAEEIDIFIPENCSEEDEQGEAALVALQRADEDDEMEEEEDVEWGT
jgi:PhoPQ-activated pathogenicity-related protein